MFQPNYPKAALGIEKEFITALAVQKEGRGRFGIRQAATVDLPAGLLVPSFTEANIANQREFSEIIGDACVRAGLERQKRWSVSLPGNAARTAILTFDATPTARNEFEEIFDWKAESSFGAQAAEMRISRHKLSPDHEGRTRYFATAIRLAVIDEYESTFESMGWHSGLILPRAVSEANWLIGKNAGSDSLLISSQSDGFTALLLRGAEPVVVRNVTCTADESDDEIYRLLMFYNDRLGKTGQDSLERVLVLGKSFKPGRIKEISHEALGREIKVLSPDDVGLNIPVSSFSFDDLAAPAGIAAFGD